jgi:cation:H+ antiporter
VLAIGLMIAYGFYVRRHFASSAEDSLAAEAVGEVKRLYLRRLLHGQHPSLALSIVQTLVGLAIIVGGAQIFVHVIDALSTRLGVSHLVFALLVAPIATELPEALNSSVIWARRGKDVLALGNITGAMVFQATFPVAIGLLFTPWHLDQAAGVAALIALIAAGVLYLTATIKGQLRGPLLLFQGAFYAGYVVYVIAKA